VWLCYLAAIPVSGNSHQLGFPQRTAACFCSTLQQKTLLPAAAVTAVPWHASLERGTGRGSAGELPWL